MSKIWEESSRGVKTQEQGFSSLSRPEIFPSAADDLIGLFKERLEESNVDSTKLKEKKKYQEDSEETHPSLFEVQREVGQYLVLESQDTSTRAQSLDAIIDQLATAISVLEQPHLNDRTLQLSLQNVGILDGVRVDMCIHGDTLTIVFLAEESLAYDFLKKNLPHLQKTLETQGLGGLKSFQIACYEKAISTQQEEDPHFLPKNRDEKG